MCFGVVAAFAYSAYQFFWQQYTRISRYVPIHFADIVLMFGCMALCAWNWPVQRVLWWRAGLVAVAFFRIARECFPDAWAWLVFLLLLGVYLAYLIVHEKSGLNICWLAYLAFCLLVMVCCSLP